MFLQQPVGRRPLREVPQRTRSAARTAMLLSCRLDPPWVECRPRVGSVSVKRIPTRAGRFAMHRQLTLHVTTSGVAFDHMPACQHTEMVSWSSSELCELHVIAVLARTTRQRRLFVRDEVAAELPSRRDSNRV